MTCRPFYRSLDVFVMTSDSEGLPYSQIEAMAAGLPSVVTSAGDLPVVVRDGLDGYVVPRGEVGPFAERLEMLLSDPERRHRMGASARERACDHYSNRVSMDRTVAVVKGLTLRP